MVGHGEVHHACGALLLGQLQTGAAPALEHAGLGVLVCGGLELCAHRHSRQVGNSAAVLQGDLCIGDLEFIRRSNELRHQIHIMVGHGEVHHACGALLLGQLQTGAVPVLEHAGLGVLVCGGLELCAHRHSRQVGNSAAVLQGDLCIGDLEFIRRSNELRHQIHIMVGHGEVHHACGALLLGQLQTGAAPALEHAGLGVLVCGGLELCAHRHSRQVGNSAAVLQGDLCIGDLEFIRRSNELRHQIHIMVGHGEVHHACGALLLGQLQTGAAPALEHAGLGVLVCGGLELCAHRHSRQVGNSAAVLQGDLCIGDLEFIRRSNELRHQIHIMVGHGEVHHACGALLLGQLQTGAAPALEHAGLGVLVCGSLEFCTHGHSCQVGNSAAILQGDLCIGDIEFIGLGSVLGVLCFQCDVICGHREGDGRLGGVHVSGQTGHFPTGEGVTVLLVCGEAELLTCNVLGRLVVHGQGVLRLRHSIGVHFVLVANVVVTRIHHDVNAVSACLGGLRHRRERAILRDIPDRIQRCIVKIHRAFIGCSLGLGVILKVVELRLISAYHLADIKRAFCVLVALLRYDALLVEAVHVRSRRVGFKHLVVVGAHIDEAQFAHAILAAFNGLMFDRPGNGKVALAQGREGQLSGGGHVHHNRLTVILGGQGQGLAICGKLCAVVSADILAVDVRDCIAEADLCLDITDKVNRVCCCGIVVEAFHSAVRHHQLALLLTGGKESAFNIAAAHRIGNSSLAVAVRFQAAKDHGILDDRFLRGIARQLDIVEHTAGDLAVLVQLDLSDE